MLEHHASPPLQFASTLSNRPDRSGPRNAPKPRCKDENRMRSEGFDEENEVDCLLTGQTVD